MDALDMFLGGMVLLLGALLYIASDKSSKRFK